MQPLDQTRRSRRRQARPQPPRSRCAASRRRSADRRDPRGLDLDVRTGETLVILGASGSGKSTLLRTLVGLEPPDGGTVRIWGTDIYAAEEEELAGIRRRLGMAFQGGALFGSMTIGGERRAAARRAHRRAGEEPPHPRPHQARHGRARGRHRPASVGALGWHAQARRARPRARARSRDRLLRRAFRRSRPGHRGRSRPAAAAAQEGVRDDGGGHHARDGERVCHRRPHRADPRGPLPRRRRAGRGAGSRRTRWCAASSIAVPPTPTDGGEKFRKFLEELD